MKLIEKTSTGVIIELVSKNIGISLKKIDNSLPIKMFEKYHQFDNAIDWKIAFINQLASYNTKDKWTCSNKFSHEQWDIGIAFFAYHTDEYS